MEAYLKPPQVICNPGPAFAAGTRPFQGISSLARGRDGRLWAVWYGGPTPGEDENNYVILAVSTDSGASWSDELLVIDPDGPGPLRAFDPEIWLAPDGRLWLFWAQHSVENRNSTCGVWAITAVEAEGPAAHWSAPRRLCDGVMMCKPLVLSTGEWALPVSFWHRRDGNNAAMVVSDDDGATWAERGAASVPPSERSYDELMIVERKDASLWMLVRTNSGIGESVSRDGGRTWSDLTPSAIPHVNSRFFIRRLQSGRLLLVRHNPINGNFARGGEVAEKRIWGTRSHLIAYLSDDDGRSWSDGLLLDERDNISYPDGDQDTDGTLCLTYDFDRYGRSMILLAVFREEDVAAGRVVTPAARLQQLISQPPPYPRCKRDDGDRPLILANPGEGFQDDARPGAMILGMDCTPKGRVWGCWTGTGDKPDGYILLATSDDGGDTWSKPRLAVGSLVVGQRLHGALVGCLWSDPKGRLWLFFDQQLGDAQGRITNWYIRCADPDAGDPSWSEPVCFAEGCTLNKPIMLANGDWLLPVSDWHRKTARVFASTDEGCSWKERGCLQFPDWEFDEHMMVDLRDGRIWMLARTSKQPFESFSTDHGATWSEPCQAATVQNINARFFLRRLKSGRILLVKNGSPAERLAQRSHMSAWLSADEGRTWTGGLLLDERSAVSYPDGFESPDGLIHILYDWNRHTDAEILLARFRETDVLAGKIVSADAKLRMLANKATGPKPEVL